MTETGHAGGKVGQGKVGKMGRTRIMLGLRSGWEVKFYSEATGGFEHREMWTNLHL